MEQLNRNEAQEFQKMMEQKQQKDFMNVSSSFWVYFSTKGERIVITNI